jgi:DNA helicase-2/ATP-dependent DNA helicase PcrA
MKPKLTFKGKGLDEIPGVRKGFIPSAARKMEDTAAASLFSPGDRVRHPKFGAGTVQSVSGYGKDARIRIQFDKAGAKELALAIAPIVRTEEET